MYSTCTSGMRLKIETVEELVTIITVIASVTNETEYF
jgi:hypothetical protein